MEEHGFSLQISPLFLLSYLFLDLLINKKIEYTGHSSTPHTPPVERYKRHFYGGTGGTITIFEAKNRCSSNGGTI